MPPNRVGGGVGPIGGGGSSSSSTSRTTTTRSPPYYTTPRPLLTTSPGQRYRTTTTLRQPVLIPAGGSPSDTNQIPDTNQKAGERLPPGQVPPAPPQPPALPPQDFCSPRVIADISWPRTQQGQTAKQPCPVGTLGKEAAWVAGQQNVWNVWGCFVCLFVFFLFASLFALFLPHSSLQNFLQKLYNWSHLWSCFIGKDFKKGRAKYSIPLYSQSQPIKQISTIFHKLVFCSTIYFYFYLYLFIYLFIYCGTAQWLQSSCPVNISRKHIQKQ